MVYSSYFGNVGKLFKMGFEKKDLVGISVYKCKWIEVDYCKELFVKKSDLWSLKNGNMEWREYCLKYYNHLYDLDVRFWMNFEENFNGKVLLCFEKDFRFCHRNLVRKFLKFWNGGEIQEII